MAVEKLLVANRGEIASRILRTCKSMGIATVAVFSDADRDAPFVAEAHEAVSLGGVTPAESYLRADALVDAARRTGADAIHPGYGFLAESPDLARRCAVAGLVFVGPPADVLTAMGSKLAAKERMHAAGVPVLPAVDVTRLEPDAVARAADAVGWPVLVKASAGGGGKGMRIVLDREALAEAVEACRGEAARAFGDATVFLERHLDGARHVEVQIVADAHGNLSHLFERECSVQRRFQKVVEEAPSPTVGENEALRERLVETALAAARAVGYVSAGTVEFLLTPSLEVVFLEMNTRLQVEHAVTEAITGLDLVRLQILVAQGDPLPEEALRPRRSGHAVETRLYAEDPERGFLPVAGVVHRFRLPEAPGLRVDAGIADGATVSTHYDPLLAKVIAHAPTRGEAIRRLAAALAGMTLHGVGTNRDLLVRILRHPEFLAGATDTRFLERPGLLAAAAPSPELDALHAAAAALAAAAERRATAPALGFVPPAWRNNPATPQHVAFDAGPRRVDVSYGWDRSGLRLEIDGRPVAARARADADAVDLEVDGVRRRYLVHRVGRVHYVDGPAGRSELVEIDRFPVAGAGPPGGSLLAPMPGTVLRVAVREGEEVLAGSPIAVLEAMKMEHVVRAPRAGTVRKLCVREGEQVQAGIVLAVIDE